MKRWQRVGLGVALGVSALVVLLGAGLYVMASIALSDLCGNTVVATEISPDRAMKAVLFERNCGATTGFSSQVSVLRADEELPNEGGNVFAANEGRGREATSWGGPYVALQWRNPRTLSLKVDSSADVRFSADHLGEVAIVREGSP